MEMENRLHTIKLPMEDFTFVIMQINVSGMNWKLKSAALIFSIMITQWPWIATQVGKASKNLGH